MLHHETGLPPCNASRPALGGSGDTFPPARLAHRAKGKPASCLHRGAGGCPHGALHPARARNTEGRRDCCKGG